MPYGDYDNDNDNEHECPYLGDLCVLCDRKPTSAKPVTRNAQHETLRL
ncbi:MAG: hypothetical protein JRJ60_07660 [Deltaproteobacteria bacterium]|nr:hypothetical protein [Deltaproteobacteria bacterium]